MRPDSKARLERAATLSHVPDRDSVHSAAEDRAEQVLSEHEMSTRVPGQFHDDLLAALDAPPVSNDALVRAAKRAREVVIARL